MNNIIIETLFNELIKTEKEIIALKEKAKQPSKHSQAYKEMIALKEYKRLVMDLYEKIKAV